MYAVNAELVITVHKFRQFLFKGKGIYEVQSKSSSTIPIKSKSYKKQKPFSFKVISMWSCTTPFSFRKLSLRFQEEDEAKSHKLGWSTGFPTDSSEFGASGGVVT